MRRGRSSEEVRRRPWSPKSSTWSCIPTAPRRDRTSNDAAGSEETATLSSSPPPQAAAKSSTPGGSPPSSRCFCSPIRFRDCLLRAHATPSLVHLLVKLKDMVLNLSGTQRQGVPKWGCSLQPRGQTSSMYYSGYYCPGVVQDDMVVPPTTYLGHGSTGGVMGQHSFSNLMSLPPRLSCNPLERA